MFTLNPASYFRHKPSRKYGERFLQGSDYRKLKRKERRNRKGHKYEMLRRRIIATGLVGIELDHEFFRITADGLLELKVGYRWDGPSGPTVDTASFMRGSGGHDIWFQILRELDALIASGQIRFSPEWPTDRGVLRRRIFDAANRDLRTHCIEDGMMWPRYHWVYYGVDKFGAKHAGGV